MAPGLTEDDLKRIDRFVRTSSFRRRPEMLCPDGEETDADENAGNSAADGA